MVTCGVRSTALLIIARAWVTQEGKGGEPAFDVLISNQEEVYVRGPRSSRSRHLSIATRP